MHNIFLYAVRESEGFRQVEESLTRCPLDIHVRTLPPGSAFTSPLSLELRSNAVLLLFALDDADIEEFLRLRHEYASFRIILIFNNEQHITNNRSSLLSPRFVAYREDGLEDVIEYVANIFRKETNQQSLSTR